VKDDRAQADGEDAPLAPALAGMPPSRRELYADADSAETTNLAASEPETVLRLSGVLAAWLERLELRVAPPVELDDETLEQLRRLGYLD
jgi:hypothetical protein